MGLIRTPGLSTSTDSVVAGSARRDWLRVRRMTIAQIAMFRMVLLVSVHVMSCISTVACRLWMELEGVVKCYVRHWPDAACLTLVLIRRESAAVIAPPGVKRCRPNLPNRQPL